MARNAPEWLDADERADWERHEAEWTAMTPAERVAELRSMDAHVADVERRRQAGEPA